MNDLINITEDGRVYICTDCPYHDRVPTFCGFCIKKILDDIMNKKKEASGDGI